MRRPGLLVPVAIAAGLAVAAGVSLWRFSPLPPGVIPPVFRPQPQVVSDPLDGETVPAGTALRRPIAVMIDNHPEARPQWGLSSASRVYEAITEGGITRYLAVYGPKDADRIGPVRSARTQFLHYALELNASIAHVGGNEDALALIDQLHLDDLNEFRYPEGYRRIFRSGIAFEHTVFTSTEALRALVDRNGWGEMPPLDPPAPCGS